MVFESLYYRGMFALFLALQILGCVPNNSRFCTCLLILDHLANTTYLLIFVYFTTFIKALESFSNIEMVH